MSEEQRIAQTAKQLGDVEKELKTLRSTRSEISEFVTGFDPEKEKAQGALHRGWTLSKVSFQHRTHVITYTAPNKAALNEIGRLLGYILLASYDRQINEAEHAFKSLHHKISGMEEAEESKTGIVT